MLLACCSFLAYLVCDCGEAEEEIVVTELSRVRAHSGTPLRAVILLNAYTGHVWQN